MKAVTVTDVLAARSKAIQVISVAVEEALLLFTEETGVVPTTLSVNLIPVHDSIGEITAAEVQVELPIAL